MSKLTRIGLAIAISATIVAICMTVNVSTYTHIPALKARALHVIDIAEVFAYIGLAGVVMMVFGLIVSKPAVAATAESEK